VYNVAWQTRYTNLHYGIRGRLILPGEEPGVEFDIADPQNDQDRTQPVVAGVLSDLMVAWEHEREPFYRDIHARAGIPYVFPRTMFLPAIAAQGVGAGQ